MTNPNLLFPTPVWTLQLNNHISVNEEMHNYIKSKQSEDKIGINKSNGRYELGKTKTNS